ncbi:MAG: YfhO family protein [Ruminiclostridium sp.]|nr:YfhO family protein [Ruminiclostridium sp.]
MSNDHCIKKQRVSFMAQNRLPLISFIFSIIILETAYVSRGIFPFGSKDVLVIDLFHQYAPLLSELQDKLRSLTSMFYSWSGGLGTDFYSSFAYYLASPLNLLLLLFPKSNLTEAVLLLILIKTGLSGAFFTVYLKEAYGKKDLTVVAFSLMYSLSGYALAYSWNIMWLEGIYLMPLIFLGMIRLIKQGKALLYTISLGLLLFSNFYIAFFVVLFTILYYPLLLIQFLPVKNTESVISKTFQVAAFSALGAGFAAVMILPTIFALKLTSASGSTFPKDITQYFNLFDYIGRHFPIAAPAIREGLPNIYCGLATLMLAPLFFLSRRFSKAEKIAHAALLFFMIMSFNLNVLNFIWHGFHFPNQLPFRNALVYIFFLVTLAFRTMDSRPEFSNKQWLGLAGLTAGLVLITQKLNDKTLGYPDIYLILLLTGLFTIVFTMRQDKSYNASRFALFFFLAVSLELMISTILVVEKIDKSEYYSTRSGYLSGAEVSELIQQIKKIEKNETGFYRMEVMPPKTPNDPYLYNYNGISVFSSMMPKKTVTTMENFGFHTNSINSYKYEGSTLPLDSLLGVKYLIRRSGKIDEKLKTSVYTKGNLIVYENPYAVSVGYMAPKALKKWSSKKSAPFPVQNSFIENLSGIKDVFLSLKLEAGTTTNAAVTQKDPYHFNFSRNDKGKESRFSTQLKDVANQNVYFYLETQPNKIDYGYVMVGDKRIDFNAKRSTMVDVGFCEAGKPVSVELVYQANSDINGGFGIFANVMDEPKFKEAIQIVKSNSIQIERFKDTFIKGSVNAEQSGVLFTTIPYHKGWSVKVDGKSVDTYAIDEGFLAFDVDKGKHTIQMRYMTPYFPLGAGITAGSIIIILIGIFRRSKYFQW